VNSLLILDVIESLSTQLFNECHESLTSLLMVIKSLFTDDFVPISVQSWKA